MRESRAQRAGAPEHGAPEAGAGRGSARPARPWWPAPGGRGAGTADGWFQALLESAPDAMVILDDDGIIQLVNAQTEALFGYGRDDLLGRPIETLVPERFRAQHTRHRRAYGQGPQVRPMGAGLELYGLRKDGREFPVEISLSPIQTAEAVFIAAAVRDVSERKAAETRINELAQLVESSQDAILAKTLDGRITYWNAAAQRLYGYRAAEVLGRHVSLLAPAGRRAEVDTLLRRLAAGEKVEHYETLRLTRTGRLLDVDVTLWPTRGPDGRVAGACAISRDISERKQAEAELTRLYEQQRHVALTLQRSLMGTPPQVPGMPAASRYLPATQGAGVGGDWFDVVPLGAGRVGVLIGDVMGRGLEAAAVMGQLRSAAHALAKTGMPPRQLMQALDAVVADLPDQFITCCYLEIAPDAGEVTICSAGHLPALLITPAGDVRTLPVPVSVPLGVGEVPHRQVTVTAESGSVLVLYTDGLVETPESDIETRVGVLAEALREAFAATADLEEAADRVLAAVLPAAAEGHNDDITLLLVRLPAAPVATADLELPAVPPAVAEGRRFLGRTLTAWGCQALADDARLLASEILTNAIRHAHGPLRLRLRRTAAELTVEVTDRSPRLPRPRLAEAGDESGRGLILVDTLAASWGTHPAEDGKAIWFTLPIPACEPAPGAAGGQPPSTAASASSAAG